MVEELKEKLLKNAKEFAYAHGFNLDLINYPKSVAFYGEDMLHIRVNTTTVEIDFIDHYTDFDLDFNDIKNLHKIMKCLRIVNKINKGNKEDGK